MTKRLDVRLDEPLYDRLRQSAAIDGRSINRQVRWLLDYALLDWQEHTSDPLERIKERATA